MHEQETTRELRARLIELEKQIENLKCSHAQAEESKARYFNFFEHAPVGYLSVNRHGMILESNQTASGILALPRDRMAGQPRFGAEVWNFMHPVTERQEHFDPHWGEVDRRIAAGEAEYARKF